MDHNTSTITLTGIVDDRPWKGGEMYTFEVRQERETENAILFSDIHSRATCWMPKSIIRNGDVKPWGIRKLCENKFYIVEALHIGR